MNNSIITCFLYGFGVLIFVGPHLEKYIFFIKACNRWWSALEPGFYWLGFIKGCSKRIVLFLGPSKNYVTARGGEKVDDFVTYRYVYLEGEGVFNEIIT